jgi:hypothetical protein
MSITLEFNKLFQSTYEELEDMWERPQNLDEAPISQI